MTNKATYKGKVRDRNGYAVHLFYEYRGREYIVTDEHNGYMETMREKHQYEQNKIDELIKNEQRETKAWHYEGSADEAIDMFFETF